MDIRSTQGDNLNKVFDDVVYSLEDLQAAIKRGREDDSIPREKIDRALSAMERLKGNLASAGEEFAPRKRRVLGLVDDMNDPSLQTALGTLQAQFFQMMTSVSHMLKKDPKVIEKTGFERLK
jgi:hypothetical protein